MKKLFREHSSLILALSLPVVLVVVILASIYIPRMYTEPPAYSVLYHNGTTGPCLKELRVIDGKLTATSTSNYQRNGRPAPLPEYCMDGETYSLFLYDAQTGNSRSLTLEEAQQFTLSNDRTAPDGYSFVYDRDHNGIFELFGSSRSNSIILEKEYVQHRIPVEGYYSYPQFIGWVIEE